MESITCTICKMTKDVSNYGVRNGGTHLKHECKLCLREKTKQYYLNNRESVLKRMKEYKELHRDQINEIQNCQCGSTYRSDGKHRHEQSQKHQNFINGIIPKPSTKGLHTMNYKTYEGGKANPCKININDDQFKQFHELKRSRKPLLTTRETLKLMKLI